MLRAAFRNKGKESSETTPTSSLDRTDGVHELFVDSFSELEVGEELESNTLENTNEQSSDLKRIGDQNRNSLGIKNPSLDHQLDDEDENNFPYTEREIYEMQLVQLQEQLVAIMIQDQEKGERLKKYEEVDIEKLMKDFEAEKARNAELTEKIKIVKNKVQNAKISRTNASKLDPRKKSNRNSKCLDDEAGYDDWVDVADVEARDRISSTSSAAHQDCDTKSDDLTKQAVDKTTDTATSEIEYEKEKPVAKSKFENYKKKIIEMIVDRLWDFVNEETETNMDDVAGDDGDPLAVKTLKENINRFTNEVKPVTMFIKSAASIGRWSNPACSLVSFIVYMYAARHGYLFSLLLMLAIWKLFWNYLYARGFAAQIGFSKPDEEKSPTEDKSWSDKFQLVLQVSRKVQNILGKMADSLEKIKNLLMWQHPATKTLFTYLCLLFIASILLNGSTLFMFIALGFGFKTFITGPVYAKFPKVKQRYDGVARIWDELPTDADLAMKHVTDYVPSQPGATHVMDHSACSTSFDQSTVFTSQSGSSQVWANFCERVKISPTETPLPTWEEGRRCTLMNKDKPLTNMKHGKLFLTQNFLCFERGKTNSSKNMAIKLTNILRVSKCKPIGIMPGTGMAIEIWVKGSEKPYVFGALMGRDELFDNLIMTGNAADLDWAKMR